MEITGKMLTIIVIILMGIDFMVVARQSFNRRKFLFLLPTILLCFYFVAVFTDIRL